MALPAPLAHPTLGSVFAEPEGLILRSVVEAESQGREWSRSSGEREGSGCRS